MGLDRPKRKTEKKETELTGYESAQRKHFHRAEAEKKRSGELTERPT